MIEISIIVPVYNTEKYLRKCLDSILQQTYDNIEIIVVNDGSTDNSLEILNEYSSKYSSKIKLLNKSNGGLGDARNYAIPFVNGNYIGFIDSDDYIHPEMFELLYNKAINEKADMAICEFYFVDENENILNETNICKHNEIEYTDKRYAFKYGRNEAFNKIYKKELFLNSDIRYPHIWFEDYPTTPFLIEKANKITYVDKKLYYYVQRKGSIMNQAARFSNRNFEILQATEIIINNQNKFSNSNYLFFIDEVAPVHAFIRFYKNIILINDKIERNAIIKRWGNELNRLLPNWYNSSAIKNLLNKTKNPVKKYILQIIINTFKTGNTNVLNFLLKFKIFV